MSFIKLLYGIIRCSLNFSPKNIFILKTSLSDITNRTKKRLRLIVKMNQYFQTASPDLLMPPLNVKGMKTLNRNAFTKMIYVPFVKVPVSEMKSVLHRLKPVLLKIPKFNPVIDDTDRKQIVLNPILLKNMCEDYLDYVKSLGFDHRSSWIGILLKYENYSHKDILKAILPDDLGDGVSGFNIIGHLIHLNLREAYTDYKSIIAQILLDTHPKIRTVVNKVDVIESKYRNFELEVLGGDPAFEVDVKENKCRFVFDFSKVFWNPRLSREHEQICKKLNDSDVVFDVFAGVGPFAIPAAVEKKAIVYANDLNPEAYKWLTHNAHLNKVHDLVHTYNMDGRDFIQIVVKDEMIKFWGKTIHIIMNLPACALEFLDAFKGLLKYSNINIEALTQSTCLPIVYCYFFVKSDSAETDQKTILNKYLDNDIQKHILEVKPVRLVAPNKHMFRLVFNLTTKVLLCDDKSNGIGDYNNSGSEAKKIKLSAT